MGWDGMGRDWMVLFCNQKWNRSRKRSDTHPSEIERYETRPGVPGWRSCKLRKADRVGSRWISWGDGWTWVSFCWHLVISQWFGWCISRQRMECEYDCEKNTHKILDVFVTLTWAYTNKETTPKSKSKPTTPTPTPTPPTPLLSLALYIHFHWLSYSFLKVLERLAFRKRIPTTGSWHNATCWKRVVCSTQKSIFSIRRTFSWVFLAFFCFFFVVLFCLFGLFLGFVSDSTWFWVSVFHRKCTVALFSIFIPLITVPMCFIGKSCLACQRNSLVVEYYDHFDG